ncbi:neuraminidase-like domain-containing protein [Candidatus Williamhamiltonella defendens]|uniref:Tc toxin subunit A-related protein n=1 Tax=Candidatus Williamhamiltonella defendens TaxID=138072 RepID=UPI001581B9C4|nr:neuraminidase-like domain-containing protein [Candidatus Hamiltonella defensa]
MYDKSLVDSLFEKAKTKITSVISLDEIGHSSFDEFCEKVGETLNYTESQLLYGAAEEAYQYKAAERRKRLVRANPQLRQAKSLDIQPLESDATEKSSHRTKRAVDVTNKGDEDRLLNRDHQYVPAGHVASMFSPAAYLAELYKNALYLHDEKNARSLKKRRPDLASLTLSQDNLDKEVSTLSLSNELLLQGCQEKSSELTSKEKVLAHLSTHRLSGSTPYHHAFQTLRHSVIQGKMTPEAVLAAYAEIAPDNKTIAKSHMGIFANIDPELCRLLTEKITEQNVGELFKKNFGIDCTTSTASASQSTPSDSTVPPKADLCRWLLKTHNLAKYYDIPIETVEKVLSATSPKANNIDLYIEGKYTQAIISGTKLSGVQIIRTPSDNYSSQLYYANLIPSGGKYSLKIKPRSWANKSINQLYIYQNNSNQDVQIYVDTNYGAETEKEIIVDNLDTKNGTRFYLRRKDSTSYTNAGVDFNVTEITDVRFFLLKLNKLLRLSKTTGLSPTEIERIILAHNTEMNVDASVIASLFGVVRYQQRYNLSTEEAVILYGASLSQHTIGETRSQFDRLFNQVPCSENTLAPNDQLKINLNPDNKDNQDWKSALKQAFQVNDTELLAMVGSETLKPTLSNLSRLYFIHLLGRIHHLTASQTMTLLNILYYPTKPLALGYQEAQTPWSTVVENVYQTTQWLKEEALTVEQLFLMTTTTYSSLSTPEMVTLVQAIKTSVEKTDEDEKARAAISPAVGSAFGINDLNVTENILNWLDALKTGDQLDCKSFINTMVDLEIATPPDKTVLPKSVIDFCHRAAQLALIVQGLTLGEPETKLIGRYPKKMLGENAVAPNAKVFKQLTTLRDVLTRCGRSAPQVVDALINDKLTLTLLANAVGEEEQSLILGAACLKEKTVNPWPPEGKSLIGDVVSISRLLQILKLAKGLHVSPPVIKSLMALNDDSDYAAFQSVANSLLAGLDESARQQVHNTLDEALSAALSQYFIRHVLPAKEIAWVETRDDLFQYLLIDNQVSSAVKTSKIASAIASLQLYIDSCLQGREEVLSKNRLENPFFDNWEQINKRYSQWAPSKQLIYFPENYIDPTQRVGQTGMMDKLLQAVSQGPLNKDTVEDAFKTYLTDFEQIANLSVITGYHDGLNTDRGLTYFIGATQANPAEYYWRTVDQSQRKDGKFPASAWGEWKKIDTSLQPAGELIRPVVFNSRLYILWVERQEKAEQKNGATTRFFDYTVKLAHLRHDGTWGTPSSFPLNLDDKLKDYRQSTTLVNDLSLYCAPWLSQDKLIIIVYKKDWILKKENEKEALTLLGEGLFVTQDMTHKQMEEKDITSICTAINNELSTKEIKRINNQYDATYSAPSSITERNNYKWGDHTLSMIYGSSLQEIKLSSQESAIKVTLRPVIRIIHNGCEGLARHQCNLMKKYGQMGDKFLIFNQINKNPNNATADATIVPVLQYKGNKSNNPEDRFIFYTSLSYVNASQVSLNLYSDRTVRELQSTSTSDHYGSIKDNQGPSSDYKSYIFMMLRDDCNKFAVDIGSPIEIDTTIEPSSIALTMEFGTTKISGKTTWSPDNLEESTVRFSEFDFDIPDNLFINNRVDVTFTFSAKAKDRRFVGSETFIIPITRKVAGIENVISLHTLSDGAQYLESQCYRTRLNTLFAKELLSRAHRGIDAILSLDTQKLPEPKLGEGSYVTVTLKKYDPAIHGSNKIFSLWFGYVYKENDEYLISRGELSEHTLTTVKIFLPRVDAPLNNQLPLRAKYQKKNTNYIAFVRNDSSNPDGWKLDTGFNNGTFDGLESISGLGDSNEVMDFTGANALYFWELFYYLPMLVTRRLLQEQQFDDADRWLKYVYSQSGYRVNGQHDARHWNVRPLLEDTGWNAVPENFTDPDAVAQHDPMHYKLATLMCQLDLIIARGDAAYRMLERDTLVEAMMWYQQALRLLGPEPSTPSYLHWNASDLAVINEDEFSSQENVQFKSYWQTLRQRIYNLRHNLNIDGQPLFLPLYAKPANPHALRSALVASTGSSPALPNPTLSLYRFPLMLERARGMVNQLSQFGSLLSSILERQDAESLASLLQNQAQSLLLMSVGIQNKTLEELKEEKRALGQQKAGISQRLAHYQRLYDENISAVEYTAIATRTAGGAVSSAVNALYTAGALANTFPNVFGMANGGCQWGAVPNAAAKAMGIVASGMMVSADTMSQYESYRRRREEWEIQRDAAQSEVSQLEAQLNAHDIRHEAAVMQKNYLETQQKQAQEQLEFLQRKFSNQLLYSGLRGRLSAIYYQFYDLTISRCLMAEAAYHYEVKGDPLQTPQFIKPKAWQSAHAGLLCGEALTLNLAQMEDDYLKWESRALEVTRTVCLSEVYADQFTFSTKVVELVNNGQGTAGNGDNSLKFNENQLQATLKLSDLKIKDDYPASLGEMRRIKQISVTLPALVGPYQDVRAVLSYGGSVTLPRGCRSLAVSHGMNDSGQFQLDFNDGKFLPFEGIPVNDSGVFTLSFPQATGKQKALLLSLSDIILHIRYTIRD